MPSIEIFFQDWLGDVKFLRKAKKMKTEVFTLNDEPINIPVPESYKDCLLLIKSDDFRLSGKMRSSIAILIKCIWSFNSSVLFWFRLSQYKGYFFRLCRYMYERVSRKFLIQIPISTKIGYGLYIGHGIGMVVNGGTVIGNNVNLSQFLNIGTNHETPAIVGDNVYIGPHVCVVEDVKIGCNSTIGAGAVITRDVPKNATVAGVPAKVLNYNNPGRYIGNPFLFYEKSL